MKTEPKWFPIETAPHPNVWILGRNAEGVEHETAWGKTSHVPLYGWNYGNDVEDMNLWHPIEWMEILDDLL